MKKILIIMALSVCAIIQLNASIAFERDIDVKRIYTEGHFYIQIGKTILHDPDCGCQDTWLGIKQDDGTFIIRRIRKSDQD